MRSGIVLIATTLATPAFSAAFDYKTFDPGNPAASGYTLTWEDQFDETTAAKTNYNDPTCRNPRTWWWHRTDAWGECKGQTTLTETQTLYKSNVPGAVDGKALELHIEGGTVTAMFGAGFSGWGENVTSWGMNTTGYFEPGWFVEFRFKFDPMKIGWGHYNSWPGIWAMPMEWRYGEAYHPTITHHWAGKLPGINHFVENDLSEFMRLWQYTRTTDAISLPDRYGLWNTTIYVGTGTWADKVATITVNNSVVIGERYVLAEALPAGWNGTWRVLDASPTQVKLEMPNDPGGPLTHKIGLDGKELPVTFKQNSVSFMGVGGEFWILNAGLHELKYLVPGLNFADWHVLSQLWVPGDASNGNRGFIQTYMDGKPISRYNWVRDPTHGGPVLPPYTMGVMDDHHYFFVLEASSNWAGVRNLSSASWADGTATFTYTSGYPVNQGDKIRIRGVSPAGYNGDFDVLTASAGTATVSMSDPGNATGTGGTIDVNGGHPTYDYLKVWRRTP